MMYGIPNMKLEKSVIDRRIALMKQEGVVFHFNSDVGKTIKAEELKKNFDAVILACGAKQARSLNLPDQDKTEGVYFAVDFLKSTTRSLLDENLKEGTYISAKKKHVVIVGGGDTGNDCVATCIRHGCTSVTQIEMMPCPPKERAADNPWPEWPKILKTDYGQQEAIALFHQDPRIYETTIDSLVTEKGKLKAVKTVKVRFENRKLVKVEGSEKTLPCDLLIIAAGFIGCESYTPDAFHAKLGQRHTVQTEEGSYHVADNLFTAGDMHRGQSLVVWAIVEGRECAREVDQYLMGYTNL